MFSTGHADIGPHQPKYASFGAGTADISVVAAVTGKKIRVLSYVIGGTGTGAVDCKWQSGSGMGATDLSGLFPVLADVQALASGYNPDGHFETAAGAALNLNQSGTEALGGHVTYIEV